MKVKRVYFIILYIVLAILVALFLIVYFSPRLLPSPGIESPPTINQFYGSISYANGSLINSAQVYAVANSKVVQSQNSNNGYYGNSSLFIIENLEDGTDVNFYINFSGGNIKAQDALFSNIGLTHLDLIAYYCGDNTCSNGEDCSSCPQDCGECQNDNGGGGGGGNGFAPACTSTCASLNYSCGIYTICGSKHDCGNCTSGSCENGKCVVANTPQAIENNSSSNNISIENPAQASSFNYFNLILIIAIGLILAVVIVYALSRIWKKADTAPQ